ncbi:MAG: bifunctional 4-hydroxy-2-oxoglutarate aldolase/2-dehydro-3-deoxy-phosphogluconate aldolase [Maricaulaceae bacterium]
MSNSLMAVLEGTPVVPLVGGDNPEQAVEISKALIEGGLTVLEVVLRSDAALDCLEAIVKAFPGAHVGAGTVVTPAQARKVIEIGATFVVSPGLDAEVVKICQDANIPILPGVVTATELTAGYNMGLRTMKFFPAGLAGGPKMLKAFASVFRDVRFMPTGGVKAANLHEFLEIPAVLACGGSWLTPKDAIEAGDFAAITTLAKEAIAIAQSVR